MKLTVFFLLVLICFSGYSQVSKNTSNTWDEVLSNKKGTVTVFWNSGKPYVYKDEQSELAGIEPDLMKGFKRYVKSQYDVDLSIEWNELTSFNDVYDTTKNAENKGSFGISAFSILAERKKEISFSPSYLKDISIIASKNVVPTINTKDEYYEVFKGFHAVASANSTYEKNVLDLKRQYALDFDIQIINDTQKIIDVLSTEDSVFGYIELPHYLAKLNEGRSIKRHNFAPVVREGYAIVYPLNSDWEVPIEAYFNSVSFLYENDQILSKYLGAEVANIISQIASDDTINTSHEIRLLTGEKEIQARELNKAALEGQKEEFLRNILILGLLFIIVITGILLYNNNQKSKVNKLLLDQQQRIKEQQAAIARKNNSLASNNKKLKKINRQKNELIGVLSHDLRTPINQIKGFAQIYKAENADLSESQTDLIDRITSTSDRLIDMIRKIMDVEAVAANKLSLNVERVNLAQLLGKIAASFGDSAKDKKIKIEVEFEAEDLHIEGDKTYLTLIFENLMSNAIKFSNFNTVVEIKLQTNNKKILSIIKDHGPGLTLGDKRQLFKKYQKLSATPTDGEQSTGLGLSIVKKYVKKMNGKVWAESSAGEGSSFIVAFDRVT